MAERLSTTSAELSGTAFSPTVDPVFQITRESGCKAVISFYGRQAATLPWSLIAQVDQSKGDWLRLAQVKNMYIGVTGNTDSKLIKVTDGE